MMDCQTAKAYIEDDLDGLLAGATRSELHAHLKACPDCRNRLAYAHALRDALKSMPVPAPDPDFAAHAFERAAARGIRRLRINSSMLIRLAASIIVIVALGYIFKDAWQPGRSEGLVASVRSNQREEIRLVLHANQDLERVTLRLQPPEGVELVGYEDQREIVWQTDLVKGDNLLVLPVIVRNRAGGSLIAEVRHGSRTRRFDLDIKVLPPDAPGPAGAGSFEGRLPSVTTS